MRIPERVLGWLFERQRGEDSSVRVLRVTGFADIEEISLTPSVMKFANMLADGLRSGD